MKLLLLGNRSTNTGEIIKPSAHADVVTTLALTDYSNHILEAKLHPLDLSINRALKELSNFGLM